MNRPDLPDARGSLFVNADWSALVPAGSPEAAFGIAPVDARRLGFLPLETGEQLAPIVVISSANQPEPAEVEPEPEGKEAPKPEDKMAPAPPNKAARRRRTK